MRKSGLLLILGAFLFLSSCGDTPNRPETLLTEAQKVAADAAATAAANAGIQGAPAGAGTLPHYYCPNSCEGSGGDAQANCPTCGTAYAHNAAFHNQTPTTAPQTLTSPPILGADGTVSTPITPTNVTPPPSQAQNAKGVFHYTCAAGCAGGAAGAGSCSSCGGALAHNQEFHN